MTAASVLKDRTESILLPFVGIAMVVAGWAIVSSTVADQLPSPLET